MLLTLPANAYHATLHLDGDSTYLLTSNAAYRIRPNEKPAEFRLALGEGPVLTSTSFVFWNKGAVCQAPKSGGPSRRIAAVPHQPQFFIASGDSFAWVDRSAEGLFTIQTLQGQKPHTLYTSGGMLDTATMLNDWVFFVERNADSTWRFGAIPVAGGSPAFTSPKSGRTPAMIAASSDIYYYDGNSLEIRQLSPDFQHEVAFARDLICSPIAVSERIFCAQVEGLFELEKHAKAVPRKLLGVDRTITALAADRARIVWVSDVDQNHLAVNTLSLDEANR